MLRAIGRGKRKKVFWPERNSLEEMATRRVICIRPALAGGILDQLVDGFYGGHIEFNLGQKLFWSTGDNL